MSTDAPVPADRLSPSWMRRALPKKKAPEQEQISRPTTSNGLLSPRPASTSSNSDDSRSARSGRGGSIRDIVNRIRSPSNASLASNKSQEQDISVIDKWFYGFRHYNQLVSTRAMPESATSSQDLAKATKVLTKNCGGQFLHGLPEAAFDFSLLWCPAGQMTKRDNDEPSWSWQAYEGSVNFPFDPTTCPDIYTAPRSEGDWFKSEIKTYFIGPETSRYTLRRENCNSLRIQYPRDFSPALGSDPSIESNTLRFKAETIPADGFDAEQLQHNGKDIPCCHLLNEQGQNCGVIMDYQSSFSDPCHRGPWEFVKLSRTINRKPEESVKRRTWSTIHPSGTPIWDGERFLWDESVVDHDEHVFKSGNDDEAKWSMLNVMLIRWVGDHAERVAIGRIHEQMWEKRVAELPKEDTKPKAIVLR